MSRLFATLALVLALSTNAFALDVVFTACTQDDKLVMTQAVVNDDVLATREGILARIQAAFARTASTLPAEVLQTAIGFTAFASNLEKEDLAALENMSVPAVEGPCK